MPSVAVSLLPELVTPEALAGRLVIVIDVLRATTTIAHALEAGAEAVVPCVTPEEARATAERIRTQGRGAVRLGEGSVGVLLGGERGGLKIDGFDLGNSPSHYTPECVGGKVVVFTTTNGTRALFQAKGAWETLAGCLNNASAVAERAASVAKKRGVDVHLLCAGTQGRVGLDDVLCAGALASRLLAAGLEPAADDSVRLACGAYDLATREPGGLLRAMRASLGGRNLIEVVLDEDVRGCADVGTLRVVPRFDAARGVIVPCA